MKVCIIHIDDESDEPRQVSERIAADALPHFFRQPIENGKFHAGHGSTGNVVISWTYEEIDYLLHYIKCQDESEIGTLNIDEFQEVVFVFDVHKEDEYGTGRLLRESETNARKLVEGREFKGIIWTNFPSSNAVSQSNIENIRLKKNVGAFAIELMEMLGFSIHD